MMRKPLFIALMVGGLVGCSDEPQITSPSDAFLALGIATAVLQNIDVDRAANPDNVVNINNANNANNSNNAATPTPIQDPTKRLDQLTPGEEATLCQEFREELAALGTDVTSCRLAGILSASLGTELVATCRQAENACLQSASDGGCDPIGSTCSFTVTDARRCFTDAAGALADAITSLPTCDELTQEVLDGLDLEGLGMPMDPTCAELDACYE